MKKHLLIGFLAGLAFGVVGSVFLVRYKMPDMMFRVYQSKYSSIEETISALEQSITEHGWNTLMVRDLNECMTKEGDGMESPFRVVELCSPKYAKLLLESDPELSALMPCAWGVYYGKNEKVYISGLNTRTMGRLFGGNINKVMGTNVAIEEAWMLDGIVQQ